MKDFAAIQLCVSAAGPTIPRLLSWGALNPVTYVVSKKVQILISKVPYIFPPAPETGALGRWVRKVLP
jgi:hypothetical protein